MTTTSAQVQDVFNRVMALTAWDQQCLADLYALLVEPMQTLYGRTLAPYQPSVVTDNIYRLRPPGWLRNGQELPPNAAGAYPGAVAGFSLWQASPTVGMGLTTEMYSGKVHPTLAVAMLAATAKLWYELLATAGR